MFVRWKRRRLAEPLHPRHPGYTGWVKSAQLVTSVRTPAGPRQKFICHFGSIVDGEEGWDDSRRQFWEAADRHLDKAGDDRERIVASLEAVVPRPAEATRPLRRST